MVGKPDATGMVAPSYLESMTSVSGADIRCVLGGVEIAEIQQVSWSIVREKGGNYVLGDENPRSFSRGRRMIGGALMFGFFCRDALLEGMKMAKAAGTPGMDANVYFEWKDKGPNLSDNGGWLEPSGMSTLDPRTPDLNQAYYSQAGSDSLALTRSGAFQAQQSSADTILQQNYGNAPRELVQVRYADQLLPFNLTVVACNEYGVSAKMALLGVEIVNTEGGFATETIQADSRYTFICREILPWQKDPSIAASVNRNKKLFSLNSSNGGYSGDAWA